MKDTVRGVSTRNTVQNPFNKHISVCMAVTTLLSEFEGLGHTAKNN